MRLPFQRERQRDPRESSARAPVGGEAGEDALQAARLSARRRLIGAVILLAIGVAGFPLLFETEPRPLPSNLPIVTAQHEAPRAPGAAARATAPTPDAPAAAPRAAPGASDADGPPAADVASAPASTTGASASSGGGRAPATSSGRPVDPAMGRPGSEPSPAPGSPAGAARPPTPAAASAAGEPAPPAARPRATATSSPPAAPAPSARPAPNPPAPEPAAAEGRFAVQVGAYSDAATLRETRQKVEKLGLKTYTQVIEGDAGRRTRVRVGPFATRAEAQAAVAKLKAAGLPANLLTL